MSYKSEREAYARCIAAHQKWQMATFLLLDILNEAEVDMRWVVDADKAAIVGEILRRHGQRGFKDHGGGI